jgi:thymidylate synthase
MTSIIISDSITGAWQKALGALASFGRSDIPLFCVTIEGFSGRLPPENTAVRAIIESFMNEHALKSVQTTANTLFPNSLWNEAECRQRLYQRYFSILPRLRRRPLNHYGIYFERMTAYGWDPKKPETLHSAVNQLESIITFFLSGNHRRSALQLAILDPKKDLVNQPRRGFPCLQQVSFSPDGDTGWSITGYYATQYVMDRGYGNYLGLARLGDYVAHSVGRKLTRINCVANVASLGVGATIDEIRGLLCAMEGAGNE